MTQPFDPYNVNFNGHKLDPYRVIDIFQIKHPAMQQIVKKALRQGAKHKDEEEDAREIISSAQRFLDMKAEERRWKTEPELPFAEPAADPCPDCHVAAGLHVHGCPRSKPDDGQ